MLWVLWVALAASIAALFIPWDSLSDDLHKWVPRGIALLQIQPFLVLTFLFITNSTSYELVRLYGGGEMPVLYRISAVWAGREGPTLLWAGLLGACGLFFQIKGRGDCAILMRKILNGVILTLLTLALIMRPFRLAQSSWLGELNPLLQTDLMVLHPPLVYLFYSLCMIVMIQTLACIFSEDESINNVREIVSPAARSAFAVGTLGIGLGGLWAYTVLDWGGYWAWDPVETASLLPWLCLLILLHLRISPSKKSSKWAVPLAILPGWFSIHATMVTRANGVWASVHAFIGDKIDGRSDSAIGRIIELQGEGLAGTEITTYLVSLVTILAIMVAWLVMEQSGLGDKKRWQQRSIYSLFFILAIPLSRFISTDLFGSQNSWIELLPPIIIYLISFTSLIVLIAPPNTILSKVLGEKHKLFSLISIFVLSYFIGEIVVGFLLCLTMVLKISVRDSNEEDSSKMKSDNIWTVTGIIIILTSTYAYLIDVVSAALALLIFLWPILLKESDDERTLFNYLSDFCLSKVQQRVARYAPVVLGIIYLTLTWMLLIAEIDGPSPGMHEMFGGAIILLVVASLTTYSWKKTVPSKWIPLLLVIFVSIGIILGSFFNIPLVGDSNEYFSDVVSRGDVAWLLLPMLLVAIPSLFRMAYSLIRKTAEGYSIAKLRSALSHVAHLGMLLLLVGHIFTTTLVDRTDPSHQVVLVQGDAVSHEGFYLTFTEWTILSSNNETYMDRFSVGDGFLGAEIEIRDESDKLLGTVNPGILRFDNSNGFPRSEVSRYSSWSGDTVFIFDWSQTQELGNVSDGINMGTGEIGLDRVRLTVYQLPGSHLVWLGWTMIVLSSFTIWVISEPLIRRKK